MEEQYYDFRASDITQVALFAIFGFTTAGAIALVSSLPGYSVTIWPALMFLTLAFLFAGVIYVAIRLAASGDEEYYDDETRPSKVLSICFICIFGTVGGLSISFAFSKSVAQAALGSVHCSYHGTCTPGTNPHRLSAAPAAAAGIHRPAAVQRTREVKPGRSVVAWTQPSRQTANQARPASRIRAQSLRRPGTVAPARQPRQTVAQVAVLTANPSVMRGLRSGRSVFKAAPAAARRPIRRIAAVLPKAKPRFAQASLPGTSVAHRQPAKPSAGSSVTKTATAPQLQPRRRVVASKPPEPDSSVRKPEPKRKPNEVKLAAQGSSKSVAGRTAIKNAEATLQESKSLLQETGELLSDIEVVYDDPLLGDISSVDTKTRRTRTPG